MSEARDQHCDWCGDFLGHYAWDQRDGPQDCGKLECYREVVNMVRAREEEARHEAEQDGSSLYGGPGRW